VLLSIWMFGGSRLEPFSFALLIGTVSGTYSTMYIASPLVIWWLRWSKRREARA
jgi:preprotein translocase subunit SecF